MNINTYNMPNTPVVPEGWAEVYIVEHPLFASYV